MSATATNFDVRTILAEWIQGVCGMYCKDLDALTDEQFTSVYAGKARTPQDFTAEIIGMNMMVASILADNPQSMPSDEERAGFVASISSRDIAKAKLKDSCEALANAVKALSPDDLGTQVQTPWGMPITKYGFANLQAGHIWYHDGQLNFLQSCHGDAEVHWM